MQLSEVDQQGQIDDRWSELKISGKNLQGRSYHSLVQYENKIYTYGGYEVDRGILEDFYEMQILESNEFEWKKVQVATPENKETGEENEVIQEYVVPGPRRRHSAMIFDKKMYIFGGQHCTTLNNNDLFAFSFETNLWEKVKQTGNCPPPIDSHNCALYGENKMVIFGGYIGDQQGTDTNSIYSFDFTTNEWQCLFEHKKDKAYPQFRSGAGCVCVGEDIYIFGGMNTGADIKFSDIWKFSISSSSWEKIEVQGDLVPENRNGHSMIFYNNHIFVFGGIQNVTKEKNDIYAFSIQQKKWIRVHQNSANVYAKSPGLKRTMEKKENKADKSKKNANKQNMQREKINHLDDYMNKRTKGMSLRNSNVEEFDQSSPNKTTMNALEIQETNFVDEKKKQKQLELKNKMLKDIDEIDISGPYDEKSTSPTTEAIKNSIGRLGDQSQDTRKNKKEGQNIPMFEDIFNPVKFKMGNSLLIGKKPCERDGQASCLVQNKFLIFGGDRHLFSFNDIYFFNLDLALDKNME